MHDSVLFSASEKTKSEESSVVSDINQSSCYTMHYNMTNIYITRGLLLFKQARLQKLDELG